MRFLNGFKTALGVAGLVVVALSQANVVTVLPPQWQPYVIGGGAVLTALGIIHKVEKARATHE